MVLAPEANGAQVYNVPRMMTDYEVASRLGIHHITLQKWVAAGKFPADVYFGNRSSRWHFKTFTEMALCRLVDSCARCGLRLGSSRSRGRGLGVGGLVLAAHEWLRLCERPVDIGRLPATPQWPAAVIEVVSAPRSRASSDRGAA